ncbi:25123_t:CDS:2 [Cetraspora pellucida]|uniref:25123_t:CDS:1 n=1 Tax=Cetraspora pellucida TaxID=1433469 RepID=A0A9N9BPQ8_9GLOM|nr:25123_t:CDS:2 [Cetraspora pellucida]
MRFDLGNRTSISVSFRIKYLSQTCSTVIPSKLKAILTLAVPPKKHAKSLSNKNDDEDEVEENISSNSLVNFDSSPANSSLTSTSIPKKKQTKVLQYIGCLLNASEIPKFECLLLHATVLAGLAFQWIENLEVKALFQFISPLLKLPNRKSLSDCIITSAANKLQESIIKLASKNKIGVTIAFDGWCNIVKQEIMRIVFITSSGEVLIWRADDISKEKQWQEEVISRILALFAEAKELNIKVNCLVTDSTGAYAAARRYLRNEMRDKMFIPCFAYQANCCISELFKESLSFKNTNKNAIRIVTFFYHSVYFTAKLHNEQLTWFGSEPNKLLFEFELYKQQKYPFIEKTFKQFNSDIIFWWSYNSRIVPELSHIACYLFGICVTTASVERLFSTIGFLHSPLCNKLKNEKVIAMSQLHAEILRTRKPKESKFNYNQSNLPSSSDFLSALFNQSQTFESNNEETDSGINLEEDNSINSKTDWDFVVNEWEELLSDEQLDEESDKESDDEIDNELDFYDSEIHLAENQSAKWKLENLFLSNLPPLVSKL